MDIGSFAILMAARNEASIRVSLAPIAAKHILESLQFIYFRRPAEDCSSEVQTAAQALQGTRLLLGRRTALKLDSILSRHFDQEWHFWLTFLEFFSASRKKTIKKTTWHHAHRERHALVVPNHP